MVVKVCYFIAKIFDGILRSSELNFSSNSRRNYRAKSTSVKTNYRKFVLNGF